MTTFCISSQKPPLQNLEALARGALPITEEHNHQLTALKEQHFSTKSGTCSLAAITLVFLGVVAAATLNKRVGVLVLSLAVIPLAVKNHFSRLESSMRADLVDYEENSRETLAPIGGFLKEKEDEKACAILNTCNEAADERTLSDAVRSSAQLWDYQRLDDQRLRVSIKPLMAEHAYIRYLAKSVLARNTKTQLLYAQALCHRFLYGSGNAIASIHDKDVQKRDYPNFNLTTNQPYVKIAAARLDTNKTVWRAEKWG